MASKSDAERRVLDYRMALSAAERERAAVESDIDARDDEIAELRGKLHGLEAAKEKLVDRHLVISASIEALGALATGKSVRDLIEPAAKDAA